MSWTDHELAHFNLGRALRQAAGGGLRPGLERELLEEHSANTGRPFLPTRFVIPFALLRRDLSAASSGGTLVANDQRAAVDVLREGSLVARLGAEVLPNLQGNVNVPAASGAVAGSWLPDELSPISAEQPTVGQVTLMPHYAAGLVTFSHQLLRQSNVDSLVARHLAGSVGRLLDQAIFGGSGSSGEPLGLARTAGLNGITGASFDLDAALSAAEGVRDSGAEPGAWVVPPAVATLLGQREIVADSGRMLISGGRMADVRVASTTAAPAASIFLADWSQLVIATWADGVEIATDPFTAFDTGKVSMRAMLICDIAVMHRGAFGYSGEVS